MAAKAKIGTPKVKRALAFLHGVTSASLKCMSLDLSARQTVILLTVYLESGPHSIKSLSKLLSISKPAVCRAVDVLENARLIRRVPDRQDKRKILLLHTAKGSGYLHELAGIIMQASKEAA